MPIIPALEDDTARSGHGCDDADVMGPHGDDAGGRTMRSGPDASPAPGKIESTICYA